MGQVSIGNRYGMLTVVARGPDYDWRGCHYKRWICSCDCGNNALVRGSALTSGNTQSCGCLRVQSNKDRKIKQDYTICGDYTICTLSNGTAFIIDTEDYTRVKEYTWSYNRLRDYIFCNGSKQIPLSRFLMNCPHDMDVDHINHNRLDNRRCNLRIATRRENCANTRPQKINTSGYKGVSFCKQTKKWRAFCTMEDKKQTTIGRFDTPEEAAVARDFFVYMQHMSFAWLNFPENIEDYRTAACDEIC